MQFSHSLLVSQATRYLRNTLRCGFVLAGPNTFYEVPDAIGWASGGSSRLIECKTSRSDFFVDFKKPFRLNPESGMGNFRYYLVPKGMLSIDKVPELWGLIYSYPSGVVREAKVATWQPANISLERALLYAQLARLVRDGVIEHT